MGVLFNKILTFILSESIPPLAGVTGTGGESTAWEPPFNSDVAPSFIDERIVLSLSGRLRSGVLVYIATYISTHFFRIACFVNDWK